VRYVFEGKEWEQIKNLKPTQLLETTEYTYRGLLRVSTFDLGGQRDFFERYYSSVLAPNIFGNTAAFFYIVDSSNKSALDESRREFERSASFVIKYSPESRFFILLTKWDATQVNLDEIRKQFSESISRHDIPTHGVSVRDGSARVILGALLDEVMPVEAKNKAKALEQILEAFSLEIKANATMLVNKADGLEIATYCAKNLDSKYLQYYSVKLLLEYDPKLANIFEDLRKLGFLYSDDVSLTFWKTTKDFVLVKDVNPEIALVVITPSSSFQMDRTLLLTNEVASRVIKIFGFEDRTLKTK
jgi:predicted regulator of Ras-like GTPase activity (Roadblock/LC7/MglB family)